MDGSTPEASADSDKDAHAGPLDMSDDGYGDWLRQTKSVQDELKNKIDDTSAQLTALSIELEHGYNEFLRAAGSIIKTLKSFSIRITFDPRFEPLPYSRAKGRVIDGLAPVLAAMRDLDTSLSIAIAQKTLSTATEDGISQALLTLTARVTAVMDAYREVVSEDESAEVRDQGLSLASDVLASLRAVEHDIRTALSWRAVNEAQEARDEVVEAAGHAREAAGLVGTGELAKHFTAYSTRERQTADRLRVASVAIAVIVSGLAALSYFLGAVPLSLPQELSKAAIGLPLVALALYLGRESSRHRHHASEAASIQIRLQTVRAYTDEMPSSAKNDIRAELGRRIFGAEIRNAISPESQEATTSELLAILSRLLSKSGGG
jgi:hypothetical protein